MDMYGSSYQPNPNQPYRSRRSARMEAASLILGSIALLSCTCLYLAVPCGALAVIFATLSRGGTTALMYLIPETSGMNVWLSGPQAHHEVDFGTAVDGAAFTDFPAAVKLPQDIVRGHIVNVFQVAEYQPFGKQFCFCLSH